MHVIFATNTNIAKRPDDLRKFLKGWFETIQYMRTHKAETVKIAEGVMHKSPKISVARSTTSSCRCSSTTATSRPRR